MRVKGFPVLVVTTVAALIIGASAAPPSALDENLRRLSLMPIAQRQILAKNLERFDAMTSERRAEIERIDERIAGLAPEIQANYLSTLRRYQLWLASLDPKTRDAIKSAPDNSTRLARVAAAIEKSKPDAFFGSNNLAFLLGDLGSIPPIELGNMLRVWTRLTDEEKSTISQYPQVSRRYQELNKRAFQRGIEFKRLSTQQEEALLKRLEDSPLHKPMIENLRKRDAFRAEPTTPLKKKVELRPHQYTRPLHHLAESLYFLENPPKPVSSENLGRFAVSIPDWIRAPYELWPAHEARRRLTILYREVYPFPEEMPAPKPGPAAAKTAKPAPKPAGSGGGITPF